MMSDWERGYAAGFRDGLRDDFFEHRSSPRTVDKPIRKSKPKKARKRSSWQVYISKKSNQIKWKTGSKKGLLNMKKMAAAYKRKRR